MSQAVDISNASLAEGASVLLASLLLGKNLRGHALNALLLMILLMVGMSVFYLAHAHA